MARFKVTEEFYGQRRETIRDAGTALAAALMALKGFDGAAYLGLFEPEVGVDLYGPYRRFTVKVRGQFVGSYKVRR